MRWLENPIFPVSQAAMLPKGGQGAVNVMMKQYTGQNVMEALLDRLDYVFKEFEISMCPSPEERIAVYC